MAMAAVKSLCSRSCAGAGVAAKTKTAAALSAATRGINNGMATLLQRSVKTGEIERRN
jgi:hypothetical protein